MRIYTTSTHCLRGLGAAALAVALVGSASPALGERDAACRTWFPDFDRTCEREFRYPGFVPPMSMPYLFEDPFITTGAQFAGIWHDFSNPGLLTGGEAGILALQLRVALTDRLSFIATKDGFVIYRPDARLSNLGMPSNQPLLKDAEGFTDMTFGFKYAAIKRPEDDFILSPAIRFEVPVGQKKVHQNQGSGLFIPSVSAAWSLEALGMERLRMIGSLGGEIAFDRELDSDSFFYNLNIQYQLFDKVVPFIELNGITWTHGGDGSQTLDTTLGKVPVRNAQQLLRTGPFEGADYGNFGSPEIGGRTLFTMAWGLRFPITRNIILGASYERALVGDENIFEQRATFMASYEF